MAPIFPLNSRSQSVDSIIKPDGTVLFKLGIGTKDVSGETFDAGWQGIATHTDGATTFAASDGVVLVAGYDPSGTPTIRKLLVDPSGYLVAVTKPSSGVLTNRSGSITTGGTAQTLAAANADRRYLFVQNLHASDLLWINFTTTAVQDQPSIRLSAGQIFIMEGAYVSTELVSVIGPTTGQKWTAKEG